MTQATMIRFTIPRPTDVPVLRPLPMASVVEPGPERFNQAAPTDGGRDKPPR